MAILGVVLLVLAIVFILYTLILILNQLIIVRADIEILKEFQAKDLADYLYAKKFTSKDVNSMDFQEYTKYRKEKYEN